MVYVVTDKCVKCKYTDCVEACPVDCFYEGDYMLVINPDECIDCGACESVCPIDAIKCENNIEGSWLEINKHYSKEWPNITVKKSPLPEADKYINEKDKFTKYIKKCT